MRPPSLGRLFVALAVAAPVALSAQQPGSSPSAAKAAELSALMSSKKLEAFAIKDTRDPAKTDRYIAVLLVPKSQLLLVAATYTRFMDIEYRLHTKDFMAAYVDLNTSLYAKDKFFVEDAMADGLVAMPKRNAAHDGVKMGTDELTFNGDFADPRRRNTANKISQEDYQKKFAETERRYVEILGLVIEQLKKPV
jgi:hypothetical protein